MSHGNDNITDWLSKVDADAVEIRIEDIGMIEMDMLIGKLRK